MRRVRILLLQVLAVAVLLEVALRIYNPLPFRVRRNHLVLPVHQRYEFHHDDAKKLDRVTYHTKNSLGFRGPDPPGDFASRLTIVTIGGSTTECLFLSDGRTWTDVLGRRLTRVRPDVWVNNAGLDGQSTFGHVVLLRDVIVPLRPAVAVFLVGANDVGLAVSNDYDNSMSSSWIPWRQRWSVYEHVLSEVRTPWHDEWAFLTDHSEIFGAIENFRRMRRTKQAGFGHLEIELRGRERFEPEARVADAMVERVRPGLAAYEERLRTLLEMCRANGITPVLVTQPLLAGEGTDPATGVDLGGVVVRGGDNGSIVWRQQEMYNDVTRSTAAAQHVLLVDAARDLPKDSRFYYDFGHLTNEGAERFGAIVADAIEPLARDYRPR
jgi:lysophospholipase L1-like esterase